jgi:hypothetical protein
MVEKFGHWYILSDFNELATVEVTWPAWTMWRSTKSFHSLTTPPTAPTPGAVILDVLFTRSGQLPGRLERRYKPSEIEEGPRANMARCLMLSRRL